MIEDFTTSPRIKDYHIDSIYFDVDDTLTTDGRLTTEAVDAIYQAHRANYTLVAVTGRSAAWGEMLFRLFPLQAVIAETGALYFTKRDGKPVVVHSEPDEAVRAQNTAKRRAASQDVLNSVPEARLALDNLGRLYDVAFDLVEEGPPVSEEAIRQIKSILKEHGLNFFQSSIHINAFFGSFDKASMVTRYLEQELKCNAQEKIQQIVYIGDSTNDGSLFKLTPLSVGVANIAPHLEALHSKGEAPAFTVSKKGGAGFAQVIRRLCSE